MYNLHGEFLVVILVYFVAIGENYDLVPTNDVVLMTAEP